MSKLTKQGVRDLDATFGRPKKQKVQLPPVAFMCNHKLKRRFGKNIACTNCGSVFNADGQLIEMGE